MKYNPVKKIIILVTILAVPGFLYYLLQEMGKNRYKSLPFFGTKIVASTFHSVRGKKIPDTIYHTLPDFTLINQNGNLVNKSNLKGKITVANLFYTTSKSQGVIAGMSTMKGLSIAHGKNRMLHFLSVSIDPLTDRSQTLLKYANLEGVNHGKWDLLTGDTSEVSHFIEKGLLLDALREDDNGKPVFTFTNKLVLLDSKQRIRGIYDAVSKEEMSKLEDEIKVLIAEELRNIKDGR